MNIVMWIMNIPFSIVGYVMWFGWNFPKLFKKVTIKNYEYRTRV